MGGIHILYQGFNFERFHMTSLEEKDPTQLIKLKTHIRISTCSSDIYYRLSDNYSSTILVNKNIYYLLIVTSTGQVTVTSAVN